jgi:hypothetical protein
LGASSLNTATVTAPLSNATLHLDGVGTFNISSKHKFDFFRYDTFGAYSPTVVSLLQTTFPAAGGYNSIAGQTVQIQLPQQLNDCYQEFTPSYAQPYNITGINPFNHQFSNQASSGYSNSQIASDTTTANYVRP